MTLAGPVQRNTRLQVRTLLVRVPVSVWSTITVRCCFVILPGLFHVLYAAIAFAVSEGVMCLVPLFLQHGTVRDKGQQVHESLQTSKRHSTGCSTPNEAGAAQHRNGDVRLALSCRIACTLVEPRAWSQSTARRSPGSRYQKRPPTGLQASSEVQPRAAASCSSAPFAEQGKKRKAGALTQTPWA